MTSSKAGFVLHPDKTTEGSERAIQVMAELVRTTRYLAVLLDKSLEISMKHDLRRGLQVMAVEGVKFTCFVEEKTFLQASIKLTRILRKKIKEVVNERRKKEEQEAGAKSSGRSRGKSTTS